MDHNDRQTKNARPPKRRFSAELGLAWNDFWQVLIILRAVAQAAEPPPEAERAFVKHCQHYFELGTRANDHVVFELKQQLAELNQRLEMLKDQTRDQARTIVMLRKELRAHGAG